MAVAVVVAVAKAVAAAVTVVVLVVVGGVAALVVRDHKHCRNPLLILLAMVKV